MSSDWSSYLQAQAEGQTRGLGILTMQISPRPSAVSLAPPPAKPSLKRYHSDIEEQVETSKRIRSRLSVCPPVRRASTAVPTELSCVPSERSSVASVEMSSPVVGEEQLCSGIIAPRAIDNTLRRSPARDPRLTDTPIPDSSPFGPHMDAWLAWREKRMSMAMDEEDIDLASRASSTRLRQVSRIDPFACVLGENSASHRGSQTALPYALRRMSTATDMADSRRAASIPAELEIATTNLSINAPTWSDPCMVLAHHKRQSEADVEQRRRAERRGDRMADGDGIEDLTHRLAPRRSTSIKSASSSFSQRAPSLMSSGSFSSIEPSSVPLDTPTTPDMGHNSYFPSPSQASPSSTRRSLSSKPIVASPISVRDSADAVHVSSGRVRSPSYAAYARRQDPFEAIVPLGPLLSE